MAFPVVQTTNKSSTNTAGANHVIALPSGITAGDLVLVLMDIGSTAATLNAHADYSELLDENLANGLKVLYRKAVGGESNPTFVSSANTRDATITYRISGAADPATRTPEIGTTATGTSATPDPPTTTPTGGAKDYLWVTFFGAAGEEADDDTWCDTPPTNFGPTPPLQKSCGTAGTNLGGLIAAASFGQNAASQNPGTFAKDVSSAWRAQTIAIHPDPNVNVDGALTVTADRTGTAAVDRQVDGNRPITATLDGTAAVDVAVAGNLVVTATLTGDIDVVGGGGVVDVDGSLTVTAGLVGAAVVDRTVDGTRPTTAGVTGAAAVDVAVDGQLSVIAALSGTAAADHTVDGNRPVTAGMTGQASVDAAVDGNRPVTTVLVGTIDVTEPGQVDISGNLTIAVSLTGTAVNETEAYMGAATDAPCTPWTPTWCINPGDLTPGVLAATGIGLQVASDLLWTLSGRRYGVCEATIRPCRRECWPTYGPGWGWWSAASGWAAWPWPVNLGGGIWVNCGCNTCGDTCSCSPLSEVVLPYPIASIVEIVIDGQNLPASGYAVWDHRIITRVDGGTFPTCNDLEITSPPGGVGAWHITATYGVSVPPSGSLAVGQLALEIAKDCAGQACALPRNVTSITRQGVSQSFDTRLPRIVFGLPLVDAFLSAKNPAGTTAPAKIYSMDSPRHRSRTGP